MRELTSIEKKYFATLSSDEQTVFVAESSAIIKLRKFNDYFLNKFIDTTLLLNELDRLITRYNETYFDTSCDTTTEELLEELLHTTISIGLHSAVIPLTNMDEFDAFCSALATIRTLQFSVMLESFTADILLKEMHS